MERIPFGDYDELDKDFVSFEKIEQEYIREEELIANKEKLESLSNKQIERFINDSLGLIEDLDALLEVAFEILENRENE